MVHTYAPTYYTSLHESVASLCKSILPFSFKKRPRLPSAERSLSKLQSDNLKWQQDSFHQILNLMGLHKEGILAEAQVTSFRSHLLDTLIAAPPELEQPVILRDKLLFLQELLYAKCISEDEYHSSKRPLLQRLAVQGAEIETRDVIVSAEKPLQEVKENVIEEEWSVIDLKDDHKSKEGSNSKSNKWKHSSTMKQQIKGAASVLGLVSPYKHGKSRDERSVFDVVNETGSILMPESLPSVKESGNGPDRSKRKPFRNLFQKDDENRGVEKEQMQQQTPSKSAKKKWGFEGLKKWKRNEAEDEDEDETTPLPLNERSDDDVHVRLVASPMGEGPDTKLIKRKLLSDGSPSDFFIDKVVGDKIKKELSRIQAELCTSNPNLKFSNDQIEEISTKLPVDKAELKKFFPKSWCDRYGDVVLDVVKKEFNDHVGEMESLRNAAREKHGINSARWTTFHDDDENCHPNLFANNGGGTSRFHETNPFCDDHIAGNGSSNNNNNNMKLRSKPSLTQDQNQNPFWVPGHGY